MKHQETLKRLREEKVSQALIDAFYNAASGQVHEEVINYQEYLAGEIKALKEQFQPVVEALNDQIKSVETLSKGVEGLEIPEPDLKPVLNGLVALSNQIANLDLEIPEFPKFPEISISYDDISRAVREALPEQKTWTFTVDRDSRGLIRKVEAN